MKHLVATLLILAIGIPAAMAEDTAPKVKLETNYGAITLLLNDEAAPKTVDNFLSYVNEGFYDDTVFHRVMKDFMIQGGGYNKKLEKKRTHAPIPNEADNGLKNVRGSIAMARTGDPHSATAQFFINTVDNPDLDHRAPNRHGWGYAVFGKVISGMEVVDKIRAIPTRRRGRLGNLPVEPVIIDKATVVEQGS